MKRIIALLLALVIALTLSACGGAPAGDGSGTSTPSSVDKDTPSEKEEGSVYQTVAKAIENTLKAASYEADVDTLLKTDLMGQKSESSKDANVKAAAANTDQPKVLVTGKSTMEGYTADISEYYDGAWRYFGNPEMGAYKMPCTFAEFAAEAGAVPQGIVVALPESLFVGAQSKKNDDGSLTVTLTADEAAIETLYKAAVTKIVYDVVGEDLNQAVTKNGVIVVTVADGYVREFKVSFVSKITAGNDKVSYDSTSSVTFVSCGKEVAVTAPGNLDAYYAIDEH